MTEGYPRPSLNQSLNIDMERAKAAYAFQRRLQVRDIFNDISAEAIHDCLIRDTPWGFAYWDGAATCILNKDETDSITRSRARRIAQDVQDRAKSGAFSFAYHCYPITRQVAANTDTPLLIDVLFDFLNSRDVLDTVCELTGEERLCRADASATLYAANQFQSIQNDAGAYDRRIGYMLNFSRDWREDWGGYLQFFNDDGDITQAFKPRFNSLDLFERSQRHSISAVPPHAPNGRLAISGWFYTDAVPHAPPQNVRSKPRSKRAGS
jgi:SM-20-related protein